MKILVELEPRQAEHLRLHRGCIHRAVNDLILRGMVADTLIEVGMARAYACGQRSRRVPETTR